MTATERLRQLLDKRGVEYSREGCETFFKNVHIWAINDKELCISISGLSPEQAVDATLGRGTCRMEYNARLRAENAKLQAEIAELEGTIECLKGLAEATGEENAKLRDENARLCSCLSDDAENARMIMGENAELRDQLEEQKCFAADLERDVRALRELVADMWEFMTTPCDDYCERCVVAEECSERQDYDCCQWQDEYVKRMRELGVEL